MIHGAVRIVAFFIALTRLKSGEQLDSLIDGLDGIYMESPGGDGVNHIQPKHEIVYIRSGNQDSLISRKTSGFAQIEEALDLLVHSADGLYFSELVYGARDG
jgi:hypothetical protein